MNQYNITNLSILQKKKKNGQDSSLFLILLFQVCIVHALLIVIPYLYFSLDYLWTDPKPVVLKVGLVDSPKGNTTTKTTVNTPSSEDTQDFLDQFSDPAQPGKVPPVPPVDKPVEKPVVKPKVEPQKPQVTPPKEQPKTQERGYLTADQIIKSGKRSNNKEEIRKQQEAAAKAAQAAQDRKKALDDLKNAFSGGGKYGTKDPGLQGVLADQENREYENKLENYIRPKWKQPSKIQLGGDLPAITLYLTIEGNGMISSVKFDPCGNNAMDESVRALIEVLQRTPVPVPPKKQRLIIPVTLKIEN